MLFHRFTLIASLAALSAGCATQYSEAPLATMYPTSTQQKAQAAAHWVLIGDNLAAQIKPSVGNNPVYVAPAINEAAFGRVLRTQVITSLVNQGVVVSKVAGANILSLDLETQVIQFSPDRQGTRTVGALTAVTGGLWALNGLDLYPQTKAIVGTAGIAALADWREWANQQYAKGAIPRVELIVTASLSNGKQFQGRRTDVYYIADSDLSLYENVPTPVIAITPAIKVKGGE